MSPGWNHEPAIVLTGAASTLHFDRFVLDIPSGELRAGGIRIALQPQPFKVLALLAERSGQPISREEIRRQLWSKETFVDFEGGLNYCIRQIRKALGEEARRPQYIETLHRRGYRFVAQVNRLAEAAGAKIWPGTRADAIRNYPQRTGGPGHCSGLAVLPFSDLSRDSQAVSLADGITELLITYLSVQSSLRVISRTSAMRYKQSGKSIRQIGKELGVDRVLEGAVLCSGQQVQFTAGLIDALTDRHEWAACYEIGLQDGLALQNHIARTVARDAALHLQEPLREKSLSTLPRQVLAIEPEACERRQKPAGGRSRSTTPRAVPELIASEARQA